MKKLLISLLALGVVPSSFCMEFPSTWGAKQEPPAETSVKTFSSYEMGLAFQYPSNWKLIEGPKPRKSGGIDLSRIFGKKRKPTPTGPKQTDQQTLFYIPVGDHTAKLEIFSALYDDTPELWESIQVDANRLLKREVQKQWREEILGVPLLLTRISYDDVGQPTTGLTGLVYSRTPRKMQFRLTAPTDQYADAEYVLRQALQSLHTVAGDLPQPEDPNRPLDKSAYAKPVQVKPTRVTSLTSEKPNGGKVVKGPSALPLTIGGKSVVLSFPAGWTAAVGAEGVVSFTHPSIAGAVVVSSFITLESDSPQSALLKATATSLGDFETVTNRKEVHKEASTAGVATDVIWRTGRGAGGPLSTCEAVGATGELYWLAKYRVEAEAKPDQRKLIDALLDGMSLDPSA